jgi:uncharacterized protein YciI
MSRVIVALFVAMLVGCAQTAPPPGVSADNYWFIFLESGKKTADDKVAVGKMQTGHIDNFKRLFAEKKLFAAGPMQDPAGKKRGIVVVKAPTKETLTNYFQPDEYVREGYMTLNATPAVAHKALGSEGIDPSGVEEVRIIQVLRSGTVASDTRADHAFIQALVDKGTIGAWYSMESGAVSEVLFSRSTDSKALQEAFAQYPAAVSGNATVAVWRQWLGKGVLK